MEKVKIIQRIKNFLTEVKGELKRVTWPTRNDLQKTTIAVIVLCIIFGIYLQVIDLLFRFLMNRVIDFFNK